VLAVGKAAASMAAAAVAGGLGRSGSPPSVIVAIGTHPSADLPAGAEWFEAGHPLPDHRSLAAGERARTLVRQVTPQGGLLILLSGGASALMAAPPAGITLDDKRRTIDLMMHCGADIQALNTVRKHLSTIKGGGLAAACRGTTVTLAVSDVVGDDVSVIGSGPGVPDPSSWNDAADALAQWGGERHPDAVRCYIAAGTRGEWPDTPKPGSLRRARGLVIGSRLDAMAGAADAARRAGYDVLIVDEPIVGEAREAAIHWLTRIHALTRDTARPVCVISGGETTVTVTGDGMGGRNQEFVLAICDHLAPSPAIAVASVGTDGIDGPTDAAGAWIDHTTAARAAARGLDAAACLRDNNAYAYFDALGDLIHTGRTDTNVGDLQICLIA